MQVNFKAKVLVDELLVQTTHWERGLKPGSKAVRKGKPTAREMIKPYAATLNRLSHRNSTGEHA